MAARVYDFALYDAQILALKRDGIKVLIILGGCGGCDNPLYNVSTAEGRQGFANYAVRRSRDSSCRSQP